MNKRKLQVQELIKVNLSQLIQREIAGSMPGMVTIMKVELSHDYKYSKVFVSCFGDDDTKERSYRILRRNAKNLRKMLGKSIRMRYNPMLTFVEDSSLDNTFRVSGLLDDLKDGKESGEELED